MRGLLKSAVVTVTTTDGEVISGTVFNDQAEGLTVGTQQFIPASKIDSIKFGAEEEGKE